MDFTKPRGYKNISQSETKDITEKTYFETFLENLVLSFSQLLDKF